MPGIATHFKILELTRLRLASSGDGRLQSIADDIDDPNLRPYFYLGAIGPALFDFAPANASNPYWYIWRQLFGLLGDNLATSPNRGLLSLLGDAAEYLDILESIGEHEDLLTLLDRLDLDEIQQLGVELQVLEVRVEDLLNDIQPLITNDMRPALDNISSGSMVPSPEQWRIREYLSWKKPGQFTRALIERAEEAVNNGDPGAAEFRAYALGYLISYSANVCGSPFVNSIVGGAYRTQWWRNRWVSNWIDAWVHGYYSYSEADRPYPPTVDDDRWNPEYEEWPSLCNADLQNNINMMDTNIDPQTMMEQIWRYDAFPRVLHSGVGILWDEVFRGVYANDPIPFAVGPDALNEAYLMTWMALWFQTSSTVGAVFGCQPADVDPPPGCDLTDPASLGLSSRPPAGLEPDWSSGTPREFDRGLFLSILGFLLGMWGVFAAGLAGIVECVEEGWDEFRCYIYWWRMYYVNALNIMHETLQFYALTYPYSWELVHGTNTLNLGVCPACGTPNILTRPTCINCGAALSTAVPIPIDFGWRLTRSRVVTQDFPARLPVPPTVGPPCPTFIFDLFWWVLHPRSSWANQCSLYDIEDPHTTAYLREEYPEFFIDSNRNPLRDGENDVKTGGSFPFRAQPVSRGPVEFGNAVDNAVDLFRHLILEPGSVLPDIPDWNLDADRGMAYLTWRFRDDIYTDPANIFPES